MHMQVYHGIVRDNVVVLPKDVHLQDGTEVEVRAVGSKGKESVEPGESPRQVLKRRLREAGLVLQFKDISQATKDEDFEPITLEGTPVSQLIIEERR